MPREEPATLRIDKKDRETYDAIGESLKDLGNCDAKELFLLAMFLGCKNGLRKSLHTKWSYVRLAYLNDRERSILKAMAVKEMAGRVDVLQDPREVYSVAEEYAAGGVRYLKQMLSRPGSFLKQFESEVLDAAKVLKKRGLF